MSTTLHMTAHTGYAAVEQGLDRTLPALHTAARQLKAIALFLAAPFIGLVYAMALPFVGIAMILWIGGKVLVKAPATRQALLAAKDVALLVAAPFIGLVYAVALPFVGIVMLATIAFRAARAPR
jgi:hypothetical protein